MKKRLRRCVFCLSMGVERAIGDEFRWFCLSCERLQPKGDTVEIKSSAKLIPKKVGTMTTVNIETGEVVAVKKNAMMMLGPPPDKCQVCAVDHEHDQPHNQQSLYYQMRFHAEHGRWPNWRDAMAHCPDDVKAVWREKLTEIMKANRLEIPDDLKEYGPTGR